MECTWDAALLRHGDELPAEILHIIQHGSNEQYLEALTKTALDARYTYTLLVHCEDLLAHICASLRTHGSIASSVATLSRLIPHAPFLTAYAVQLLELENTSLQSAGDDGENLLYLLGLFRLLRFDGRIFRRYVRPHTLMTQLGRQSRPATYLVLRILQMYLEAADNWFEEAVRRYLGVDSPDGDINGVCDEHNIDYRFLSLWEDHRYASLLDLISEAKQSQLPKHTTRRVIPQELFHPSTALIGGVLLPRAALESVRTLAPSTSFVETATATANLASLAHSLKRPRPLLLTGIAGSGKSLLVRHVAESLGKLDKMVTLHLNEQSDAKLLLGIYTTGESPGSFVWKPGVLTTAVEEGRWVLIEDIDRAPNEIMGTLLPLIERGQLLIPNRKDILYAAEGFRILATVRSSLNHRGEETKPLIHMLGFRHWQVVPVSMSSTTEQAQVAQILFPDLKRLLPQFLAVYERLITFRQPPSLVVQNKTGVARPINLRDLLKWCQRVSSLLQDSSSFTSNDIDSIYLEAVDCFIGALPDDHVKSKLSALIAEELRIEPQRRDFLLYTRNVHYEAKKTGITVGRYTISKMRLTKFEEKPFSTNPHTSRMLERVAAAIINKEPLLLVGETGVGKTTAVQHLANHLGKKLVPFNLSQQSEVGDLLGGFKPVNARTLIVPLKDEFDDLFAESFSATKNKQFLQQLAKQMAKGNWKLVCKLWRQALVMVDKQRAVSPPREGEAPSKKRKVDSRYAIDFRKWDTFASKVQSTEQQLTNGTQAFAFTFVEGNIVKAVRNGDWILLDEINLASSDTLESIVDLLDPSAPSLLLTEAGNIERTIANPDFRVFAAMNPATDVGKKDLPPGVRSRFTEIYVESPDKDSKSLQNIVQAYLRQECASDVALASDVSSLYQKLIALVADSKLVDGAGQKPHFSLRTLTRTLSYSRHIKDTCGIRRAMYEGFQMSFLTFLDGESLQIVQPSIEQHLLGKRVNIKAELQKALRKPNDQFSYVQGYPGSKHWIRQGSEELQEQSNYILTPFVKDNLENLVRAASTRQFPVLIQGPTSSGKTSMIEYLARRTGHKFTRINNHEHTDLQEYLGTYVSDAVGNLQFQEGVLVKALREGHWLVLDELNLAPTDVLEALNRLLDDNRELLVAETQETIKPHSDFMLFATQNPAGLYGGRKTLSRAFRNRFLELHFDDIPVNELQEILHRRTQLPESRCKRIVRVYRELSVLRQESRMFEQKSFATLRDLFRWALRQNDSIEQLAANGYMLLCERVRKAEERIALKVIIEKVMSENGPRVQIDEDALYSVECSEIMQYNQSAKKPSVVWTKAMRRLYVLVSKAIRHNEPVLLVGETGCGKTTVCQMLAEALQQELHTVNAHQNTETGDLIGSQRPVRNRAAIEVSLRELLLSSPLLSEFEQGHTQSTDALLKAYDDSVSSATEEQKALYLQEPTYANIQTVRTRFKALFEWTDGSLVQAMRNGEFFLLDEISLADDSVLERINSVLESQRTLLLAEKGSLDSFVAAAPSFQFFATMNPGGDFGKRELSPALRNRFTEIWVPALSRSDDLLQIVQVKLVEVAKPSAKAMVSFASWFQARFDTSATSSVSIRDTLAWVEFVNTFASLQLNAAVVHGAAMVFIDTLGANPAGLISMASMSLDEGRQACLDELGSLLGVDAHAIYRQRLEVRSDADKFGIGPFTISRAMSNKSSTGVLFTFDPDTTRSNAMRVLRALQLTKPVMLEGSPGVGKTALVTAIASAAGKSLTRINLSDQTDLLDLFGSDVPAEGSQTGTFVWKDAPFLRAMKNGEWVLLDEMNLASQAILEGLNACLDHRGEVFIPELGQSFSKHSNFRLFAAQNPHHQGGGRKGLPASFVNRFTVVYADTFKPDDLLLICQRSFPKVDRNYLVRAITFVNKLNDEVASHRRFGSTGSPWEFNLRDIARWFTMVSSPDGLLKAGTARDFVSMLFEQRFRLNSDRHCVEELFASVFDPSTPSSDLYCSLSPRFLQVGLGLLSRDVHFAIHGSTTRRLNHSTPAKLRALESVMLCVQQNWPVLLIGPPASGKTRLIEELAQSVGAEVVTLPMSAETDALDLIGGYEQSDTYRQSANAVRTLTAQLKRLSKICILESSTMESNILLQCVETLRSNPTNLDILVKAARNVSDEARAEVVPSIEILQHGARVIDKAGFEWIDGPLIEALQHGKWLVLDNANLCSPSVLDRLNSLLEPNGTLIVNECSTEDGAARIIRPHPSFRIFLTVDPRLGELSRAMRNRAVELYLMHRETDVVCSTDVLGAESTVAPFYFLQATDTTSPWDKHANAAMNDHFRICDQPVLPRLQRQLENGLFSKAGSDTVSIAPMPFNATLAAEIEAFYHHCSSFMQTPADSACVQTFHPLSNQPLVQQSQHTFSMALSLAARYDLGVTVMMLAEELDKARSNRRLYEKLKRFWKSVRHDTNGLEAGGMLEIVGSLLHTLGSSLDQIKPPLGTDITPVRIAFSCLLSFCWALLQGIKSETFDVAMLTALCYVGRSVADSVSLYAATTLSTFTKFRATIAHLSMRSIDGTGQGFVALWRGLRPTVPATMDELDSLLKFEKVIDRFDQEATASRLPCSQISDLRMAFQQALRIGSLTGSNFDTLAERAVKSLPKATPRSEQEEVIPRPHFVQAFELLCQHFAQVALGNFTLQTSEITKLEIFAQRRTTDSMSLMSSTPQDKLRLLGLGFPHDVLDNSTATNSILQSVGSSDQVCLHNLVLFEDEIRTLGLTLASNAHHLEIFDFGALDTCLSSLLQVVLKHLVPVNNTDTSKSQIEELLQILENDSAAVDVNSDTKLAASEAPKGYPSTSVTYLRLVALYLQSQTADRQSQAPNAWTQFALACLELYIPDRMYDPVQESHIRKAVYQRTKDDLQSKLTGLQTFQEHWVGEQDSLRAHLVQKEIETLGPAPSAVEICRPATSQLGDLHNEFQGLMRIVQPLKEKFGVLDAGSWSNLMVVRKRLLERYRPYTDLTTPVVGFIDCLSVARRLALQAARQSTNGILSVLSITPLFGIDIHHWLSDEHFLQVHRICRSKGEQLYWLSVMAVRASILPVTESCANLRSAIQNAFRSFYEIWRVELSRDQKATTAKSSLYQYRGEDDDSEEAVQEQLTELFPSYDVEAKTTHKKTEVRPAQTLAPTIAELYHAIHRPSLSTVPSFESLLQQGAKTSSTNISQNSSLAAMAALHELIVVSSPSNVPRQANVYVDSNIDQSRALVLLINKVRARFQSIHEAWPEHATPIEVVRGCNQILALGHAEPLVRFLPMVEKLHSSLNEWQTVASSEYSASSLLEETASLIISWRQLELSTWAGMFTSEDEACQRNAASWWYIAYEVIICASADIVEAPTMLQTFSHGLIDTLANFLGTCGLGEYSIRLAMLRDFEADLAQQPGSSAVRNALVSLTSFYSRYEVTVTQQLMKKREELEKEIKNVIQLASWKDRNIETLKQSAKASHKKLFRTVRKYRKLLSQPVAPILQVEFQHVKYNYDHNFGFESVTKDTTVIPALNATNRIAEILQGLDEESNELRKATPSAATEENKTLVQHLKTRKRRLFADVLRNVRVMGFQTNISNDVLIRQRTLPSTLVQASSLGIDAVDQELHRLLHIMPSARESAVKHSEDLTPAEVARSIVLLESMLQICLEQHQTIFEQLTSLRVLQDAAKQFATLCSSHDVEVRAAPIQGLLSSVKSLLAMLETAGKCVHMHGKLAGTEYAQPIEVLRSTCSQVSGIHDGLLQQANMPTLLDNSAIRELEDSLKEILGSTISVINDQLERHPELQPTLSQTLDWMYSSSEDVSPTNQEAKTAIDTDLWVTNVLKLLRSGDSHSSENTLTSPTSQTQKAWLLEQQTSLMSSLKGMQLHNVSNGLRTMLLQLGESQRNNELHFSHIVIECRAAHPFLSTYLSRAERLILEMVSLHAATSKMAFTLAKYFIHLTRNGFCQPPEKTHDNDQQSDQVESATGLGDGEGQDDISKDIGDDEDLSELAQDATSKNKDANTEAEKDAIDMADEELEGDLDEDAKSGTDQEDGNKDGQEDADVDEEVGQVDDKDACAVDEKTWEGGNVEEAEKNADNGKGTKGEAISAAADDSKRHDDEENPDETQGSEPGIEIESELEHSQPEKMDPFTENEENLDLADDIDMDGNKATESDVSDIESDYADDEGDVEAETYAEGPTDGDVDMGDERVELMPEDDSELNAAERDDQAADLDDLNPDVAMLDNQNTNDQQEQEILPATAEEGYGNDEDNTANPKGELSSTAEQLDDENDADRPNVQPGTSRGSNKTTQTTNDGQTEPGDEDEQSSPYKQLGDILKQWYDQHRDIEAAHETGELEPEESTAMEMNDVRFEHTDVVDSGIQAVGAARTEQSKALDEQNAVPLEHPEPDTASKPPEAPVQPPDMAEMEDNGDEGSGAGDRGTDSISRIAKAVVGTPIADEEKFPDQQMHDTKSDEMEDVDEQLTNTHLSLDVPDAIPIEVARQAWSEHESRTRSMAIVLTEHLRLILQPTQASKMRGDFRTGKRLNIKKIIPFIASSYKRDKIWMRRSMPSKRSYQIMLAIDDSESMNESERKGLAFDTLALIAKSMAMLEVGELCIVGFGETVNTMHDFSMPFTSDAGAEVIRQFSFAQSKTDVRKLLEKSIELFREARLKAPGSASNLWQLQLIISDGLCEDHPSIRQLVRQAHEEHIMVVFIVIDAPAQATPAPGSSQHTGPKQSIMDLQRAEFTKDAQGEPQINMIKYLDTFPFRYYLLVRDVLELPNVLAGALRQWFAEVVDSGN